MKGPPSVFLGSLHIVYSRLVCLATGNAMHTYCKSLMLPNDKSLLCRQTVGVGTNLTAAALLFFKIVLTLTVTLSCYNIPRKNNAKQMSLVPVLSIDQGFNFLGGHALCSLLTMGQNREERFTWPSDDLRLTVDFPPLPPLTMQGFRGKPARQYFGKCLQRHSRICD